MPPDRFPLALSDIVVSAGSTLADFVVRISLFQGLGLLEVRADRFSGRFDRLQPGDLPVVKEALSLAEEGVAQGLPKRACRASAVRTSTWARCEGGADAAAELLRSFGEPGFRLSARELGAQTVTYSLGARLSNEPEQWAADFLLERSAMQAYEIFFALGMTHGEAGRYRDLAARFEHLQSLYAAVLERFGLTPGGPQMQDGG